jgi:tRNA(Ile)-lysidine synthase
MATQLTYTINKLIIERNLFYTKQGILIAISGGQDSMLLSTLLYRLRRSWQWQLSMIHCDHQWNSESIQHARQIYRLATVMGLIMYTGIPGCQLISEDMARNWRYSLMQHIALKHGCTAIATGHTSSDRVETLLANLLRGSGIHGIQSLHWKRKLVLEIPIVIRFKQQLIGTVSCDGKYCWVRGKTQSISCLNKNCNLDLIRPLLNITRQAVRTEVEQLSIPICIDPSNYNLEFRRNRIRHQLIPYLRHYFNPQMDYVFNSFAEIVHCESLYLDRIVDSLCSKHVNNNSISQTELSLVLWYSFPIAIQRRILKKLLYTHRKILCSFEQLENIRLAINQVRDSKCTRIITLSSRLHLTITENSLRIEDNNLFNSQYNQRLENIDIG